MPTVLKIKDSDDQGFLRVALRDLLELVGSEGAPLVWVVQDVTVSGHLAEGRSVDHLELESRCPPHGIIMGWTDLLQLARQLTQVQDGVFAGCRDPASMPKLADPDQLYALSEFVLEAMDSSYWQVFARNESKRSEFKLAFRDVETTFA